MGLPSLPCTYQNQQVEVPDVVLRLKTLGSNHVPCHDESIEALLGYKTSLFLRLELMSLEQGGLQRCEIWFEGL
jgi:hypothetical protein